jgi:hypothetical protein
MNVKKRQCRYQITIFAFMLISSMASIAKLNEDIGENWKYVKDAEKLPLIRKAFSRGLLKPPTKGFNTAPFCKAFRKDLIAGKGIHVIEPMHRILSEDDSWLGAKKFGKDLTTEKENSTGAASGVGRWHKCDAINPDESQASDPENIFDGLKSLGLPPYTFYKVEIDNNKHNGEEDVVVYRENGNMSSHDYVWVDLGGCVIRDKIQVMSARSQLSPNNRDALSMLILYQHKPMVLQYNDWSNKEEKVPKARIEVTEIGSQHSCVWQDPKLN